MGSIFRDEFAQVHCDEGIHLLTCFQWFLDEMEVIGTEKCTIRQKIHRRYMLLGSSYCQFWSCDLLTIAKIYNTI